MCQCQQQSCTIESQSLISIFDTKTSIFFSFSKTNKLGSSIHVLYFLKLAAYFCSTWMTSCMQLKKLEGQSFRTGILLGGWRQSVQKNVNLNNIQTARQTEFVTQRTNRLKIRMNILSNMFYYLNGKIEQDWLNLPFGSFKVKCKKLFL